MPATSDKQIQVEFTSTLSSQSQLSEHVCSLSSSSHVPISSSRHDHSQTSNNIHDQVISTTSNSSIPQCTKPETIIANNQGEQQVCSSSSTLQQSSTKPTTSVSNETDKPKEAKKVNGNGKPTPATMANNDKDDLDDGIESERDSNRDDKKSDHKKNLFKSVGKRLKVERLKTERDKKSKTENRANKALKTISVIMGAFVICWTPYHIIAILESFCLCTNGHVYMFFYFLCYANSPINPFCYALANQQFKKTFTRLLKGDLHVS